VYEVGVDVGDENLRKWKSIINNKNLKNTPPSMINKFFGMTFLTKLTLHGMPFLNT
jgi:hypothetical protein